MFKILALIVMSLNFAFASSRFGEADRTNFLNEVRQGIAAHKLENQGKIDFQIIKPDLYEELEIYHGQEKMTREELVNIKQKYEDFIKNKDSKKSANAEQSKADEEAFYSFVDNELIKINQKALVKIKEGQVCNNWSCEDGLKCAPDPKQENGPACKKEALECKEDKDCCSASCSLDSSNNKRYCETAYKCFKPVALGRSCLVNPVCGEGECLPFNSKTSGIGECTEKNRSCKSNSECCSNSCENNKCSESYICKDCVKNGNKPNRGQKCCEGLYIDIKGRCAPDMPPTVIPQVNIKLKLINFITSIFINNAEAQDERVSAPADAVAPVVESSDDADDEEPVVESEAKIEVVAPSVQSAAVVETKAEVKVETKAPEIKPLELSFSRKSDFNTCDIKFRDDYANYLKKSNLVDLETALLSFDYVFLGTGVDDYWKDKGHSMYSRLSTIAKNHQVIRTATNEKVDLINKELTCMCLDVAGYKNIKDASKQTFFETQCPEYKIALAASSSCSKKSACSESEKNTASCVDGMASHSCMSDEAGCVCTGKSGDDLASGLKGKRLLVNWTKKLQEFNASLAVDNTAAFQSLTSISDWANNEAKWNETETKKYKLFNFSIKQTHGTVVALGAFVGAILAAGVIAILGGFAPASILTAWAAAGIIATSAITGGTGLWLMASLKGAWISKRPEIIDKHVKTYSCGKKQKCDQYSRELIQPYNNICNVHTSANACVKNFVVYYANGEPRYLVDPWIPKDIPTSLVIRDLGERTYAEKMDDGFLKAKDFMVGLDPKKAKAAGGEGKGGKGLVTEDYLKTIFADDLVVGKYTPAIGTDVNRYVLTPAIIAEIKAKAKKFAVDQKFFQEGDTENLNKFADYTYDYHFIWPKTSREREISYPTVGLTAYLDLMTNGVVANLAVGAARASNTFGNLNTLHLQDYLNTLTLYANEAINLTDGDKQKSIQADIKKIQDELNAQKVLNSVADNTQIDSQLINITKKDIDSIARPLGITGEVTLTSGQKDLLNAIGKLRLIRKAQLSKLSAFNFAIAASGNPDRAIRVASASKNFKANFTKPLAGSKGAGSIFGNEGANGNKIENKVAPDSSRDHSNSENYNTYGVGSGNSRSDSGAASNKAAATASDEDNSKLANAIEARNQAKKDKYKSAEEQTLFENITNAYIRNYDKILKKKSDKDIIEQK